MRILCICISVLLTQIVSAQTVFNFKKEKELKHETELNEKFKEYKVFRADALDLFESLKKNDSSNDLVLRFDEVGRWNMSLHQRYLIQEEYTIKTTSDGVKKGLTPSDILTYNGNYQDDNQGQIALTVTKDIIYGFVEKMEGVFFIEPLNFLVPGADKNTYVIYEEKDVLHTAGTCAAHDKINKENELQQIVENLEQEKMNCFFVELAIASDFSMFQKYGSVGGVEGHTLGVLNNAQTNYDDEFNNEILFDVVTQFVVDCSGCDPWPTGNDSGTLLSSFRQWGNGGNFGVNFDLGQLWTDRNISSNGDPSTVGVAYVGGICGSFKYQLIEDFSATAWALRVVVSHETGHNFGYGHDAGGSGFIMAPSVNNTNTWSPASINTINNTITAEINSGCFSPCVIVNPPIADFDANQTSGCLPLLVNFFDLSQENPDSWLWDFPGGTPASSTQQNPSVIYSSPGTFDVTLTVSNSAGTDTKVEFSYINVFENPVADFSFAVSDRTILLTNNSIGDDWLWDFGDGNSSVDQNPIHTYLDDGVYTVTLISTNGCGSVSTSMIVTISTLPTAGFTADVTSGCEDLTVVFSDMSSSNAVDRLWTFPGGNPSTSSSEFPVVVYDTPGMYDVTLEVSNSAGMNTLTETNYINVLSDPIANFASSITDLTVNFTNTSTDALTYLWDFGDNNSSTAVDPTHTYSNGGTFTVSLTAYNSCDTVTVSQMVTLSAIPTADAGSDVTSGCASLLVNFSDLSTNAPTSWTWDFPGGNPSSSTDQNPQVTYDNEGVYSIELIASNSAGADTIMLTDYINVNDVPSTSFNFSTSNTTASFTNTSTNTNSFSWDFGDGNFSTDENPNHNYGSDGIYSVVLTTTNSCGTSSSTEIVTIANAPTAGATADVTSGCADLSVQFTDQSSINATAWSWTFPGGTPSSSTDQNPTVVYSSEGIFNVELVASNSTGSDQITLTDFINVNDVPDADYSVSVSDLVANFTNTSTNADSYAWDFGDGNDSNDASPSHTYAIDGIYTVTLTATNACGDKSTTQTVTIANVPTAGATADVTSGCADLTVQFTDQSSVNATAWSWTFPGGTPSSSNDQNPTVVYSTEGIFNVELVASNSTGSDQVTLTDFINVIDVPNASYTLGINDMVANFSNTTINGTTYSWDFGDGNNSNDVSPTHTYAMDGVYTVVLTATNTCGDDEISQIINISNAPTAGATSNVTFGCAPLTVNFMDISSNNAASWNWTFEGGNPSSSNAQNPTVVYNNQGTYDVTLEVSNAAGSNTIFLENYITIEEGPSADFSTTINDLNVLFDNDSNNGDSYSWDFGDGNTSTSENPNHTYAADGTYTVVLTTSNNCGDEMHTEVVTVVSEPTAGFSIGSSAGCAPLTVQFTDLSSSNSTSWLWTFEGGTPSTSTDQNPIVVYENQGSFDVTLEVSNSAGSNASSMSEAVIVNIAPSAAFNNSVSGMTVSFSNQSDNGSTYSWDFGDGNSSQDENPTHTYLTEDIFSVTLTVTNDCGTDIFTEVVNLTQTPLSNFSYSGGEGCAGLQVQFTDNSSGTVSNWNWSFPGGTPSSSTAQNPLITYNTPGIYDVSLEVSSSAGSNSTTENEIVVIFEEPAAGFSYTQNELDFSFVNSSTNADTYSWDFGDGNTSMEANPDHSYSMEGTYDVILLVTNDCGSNQMLTTIFIESAPTGSFSAQQVSGCAPFEVNLIDESSDNVTSWNWSFPGAIPNSSSLQNPTVSYNESGIYSITLEVSNSAGTFTVTRLEYIEVQDVPEAMFTNSILSNSVTFSNTSSGATSYLWEFGDGNESMDANPTHVYGTSGTFEVTLTAYNDCGESTSTTTVVIDDITLPSAGFSADNEMGCAPIQVTFTSMASSNTDTWEWIFEGGNPATSSQPNPVVSYNTAGSFDVQLTVGNSQGIDVLLMEDYITVQDVPTAEFSFAASDLTVDFDADESNQLGYVWDFGDGNSGSGEMPTHVYGDAGSYEVTLTVNNECGFFTTTNTVIVAVGASAPIAEFSSDVQQGCAPSTISFNDLSTNSPTSWLWEFEGGTPLTSTDQNPVVIYNNGGNYNVQLTASNAAGDNVVLKTDLISIGELPVAEYDYNVGTDQQIEFQDQSMGATSWAWDFGDGVGMSNEQNPTYSYSASGTYTVTLVVTNFCGENTYTEEIIAGSTSSIDLSEILNIDLFPNPTSNEFHLLINSSTNMSIDLKMFNAIGQVELYDEFYLSGQTLKSYDLSQMSSGTYFIQLSNEEGSTFKKLIVTPR